MINFRRYAGLIPAAQKDAAQAVMESKGDNFRGFFSVPFIYEGDPDDMDPPRAYGGQAQFNPTIAKRLHDLLKDVVNFKYEDISARKPKEAEDALRAFAAKYDLRARGMFMEAYGTAKASGSADAQAINQTPALLNQWTNLINLINMGTQGQRFVPPSGGIYRLETFLRYIPISGVEVYVRAARNAGLVGNTLSSSDGEMRGGITGTISADDLVGIGIWASGAGAFKLLGGSKIRLRRVG